MTEYCDIALYFDGSITLTKFYELVDKLRDAGLELDLLFMDVNEDGISLDARYDLNQYPAFTEIEALIESLDGVEIDYETMAEWVE